MRFICASTLEEYAISFWEREADKPNAQLSSNYIQQPLDALWEMHKYKLPFEHDEARVIVAGLDRKDLGDLLIHQYMAPDRWMRKSLTCIPNPFPRRLCQLAALFLADGFFTRAGGGTQRRVYGEWKTDSLKGKIGPASRTMLQCDALGNLEIVDGWGRLLAYEALVQEGSDFYEVETFIAYRLDWGARHCAPSSALS